MEISAKCALFRSKGYSVERIFLQNKNKSMLEQIEIAIDDMAESINVDKEEYLKSVSRWDSPNQHVTRLVDEISGYIKPLAEEYFGQRLNYVRASIIRKSSLASMGTHGHQDAGYWGINSSKYYDVSTWIALDDIDSSNAALRIIPGSHRNGAEIQGDFLAVDFLDPSVHWKNDETLNMSGGDVAIFDPYLWHASHPCSESLASAHPEIDNSLINKGI
jgi:hypothetical protein